MLYLFKILVLLIDITQETVLKWFGLEHPITRYNQSDNQIKELNLGLESSTVNNVYIDGTNEDFLTLTMSPAFSIDTLRLIAQGLWEKIQDGLALSDIDNILIFIVIIRFIILTIRYNINTSFLITLIGIVSAYLWYRHFIQLIFIYENALATVSYTSKLAYDSYLIKVSLFSKVKDSNYQIRLTNPLGILMYAIGHGSVQDGHRIDPLSMLLSLIPQHSREKFVDPYYYLVYRKLIPLTIKFAKQFYLEICSFAAYTLTVRIGKKYCPYHIRWHWTYLVMVTLVEPYAIGLIFRINYYLMEVLIPKIQLNTFYENPYLFLEVRILFYMMISLILGHLAFILYAMLHALCGQYFYLPLFTENVELHIGPRDKTSIYSGGWTSWQDPEEKERRLNSRYPKYWYGWFGRGNKNEWNIFTLITRPIKWILKKIIKFFKRTLRKN
jgi:hypothetical protein